MDLKIPRSDCEVRSFAIAQKHLQQFIMIQMSCPLSELNYTDGQNKRYL